MSSSVRGGEGRASAICSDGSSTSGPAGAGACLASGLVRTGDALISDLDTGGLMHATLAGGGTMGTLLFLPGMDTRFSRGVNTHSFTTTKKQTVTRHS